MSAKLLLAKDTRFGKLLRLRRISIGMSQIDFAKALGISSQQVPRYEQGLNRIDAGRIVQFSEIVDAFARRAAKSLAANWANTALDEKNGR